MPSYTKTGSCRAFRVNRYELRALPRRALPTRAIKGGESLLPKRRTVLGALEQNCSVCDAWPHTPPAAKSPPLQPPPLSSTCGTGSSWGLSPRGWGEVQPEFRAADTSPPGFERGQENSEGRSNQGPGGARGTVPAPLRLADTPAELARATELLQACQKQGGAPRPRTDEVEAHPSPLAPAPPPPALAPHGLSRSPGRGFPRHAENHSAAHDVRHSLATEDETGTDPCGEHLRAPRELRVPDEANADGETDAVASVFPATSEESGSGGRGAEDRAGTPPTAGATRGAQGTDTQGTRGELGGAAETDLDPDAPAQHSTPHRRESATAQEMQDGLPHAAGETSRARGDARARTRRVELGPGDAEAHALDLAPPRAERSPRLPRRRGRDPRTPPSRPRRARRVERLSEDAQGAEVGAEGEPTKEAGDGVVQAVMRELQRDFFANA
ncbi:unnamed protein product [Closterium sp. Yama58-4]|nr:unnamed protein product [Closterium sp. Yama58-4]